jgi:homogentisate 1,2-dioxygenase
VMVDTFRPLELGEGGRTVEDPAYAWTWAGRGPLETGPDGPPPGPGSDDTDDGPAVFSNS